MITLILGGVRSGKSEIAERILARLPGELVYVATADPGDDSLRERIRRHQDRRGQRWCTLELGPGAGLGEVLALDDRPVLVDSLGVWLAGHDELIADCAGLVRALRDRGGDAVLVSDEVGLSVHPSTEIGRRFQDALGALNRQVAEVADAVYLVAAGHVVQLLPPDLVLGTNDEPGAER